MEDNGSKEHAKNVTCLHLASFSKTLYPLVTILQQPKSKASFFESVVGDIVDRAQMSKRSSARNDSEKESKIEPFTRRWGCKIHATDGLSTLSWLPSFLFVIINPSLWKVLIGSIPGVRIRLIYFKPSSKLGLFVCTPLQDIIGVVICIKVDQLLVL